MPEHNKGPKVVIIGAGFAGIRAARSLARSSAQVTLIDRNNYHLFQPLLYQIAMAALSPAQIAIPIRSVLRRISNVEVLLGEVTGIDLAQRLVRLGKMELNYDYLIVATGSTHAYFGHPEWEEDAPGLKTIEDALEIRRRVLLAFELAESAALTRGEHRTLNFVVIGAGPTGVELAGAIADISKRTLERDFRAIRPNQARVVLLEGGERILPGFPADLSASAEAQLTDLGVEVRTRAVVTQIEPNSVTVGAETIPATVVLWGAGVAASPLGRMLNAPTDRAGRVMVDPDLSVPGHSEVFVTGDLAAARTPDGKIVPGVAAAAVQMGKFAAQQILLSIADQPRQRFIYKDRGSLATIGTSKAVASMGKLHLSGHAAWLTWLLVHLSFLTGFRSRLMVLLEWIWSYFAYNHGARLITHSSPPAFPAAEPEI
ncbi:MAG TPA: NAD(P)/FAD-dependent oxidoreductase [Candidatus Saccharimonadales bacterium]|jgi:NADH dehydrogenase|nr:NAD(P)/FAD-dependent oxidoreductase [Candidatus Saccharimonadales bacterium]